jgi:hypothetical protein
MIPISGPIIIFRLRDRSVGIATGYGMGRCSTPGMGNRISLLHSVYTCSGAHSVSYPMGTGGSFPSGKAARA